MDYLDVELSRDVKSLFEKIRDKKMLKDREDKLQKIQLRFFIFEIPITDKSKWREVSELR